MGKQLRELAFTLLLIAGFAPSVLAQSGTISGTISDPTGAVIVGAQVTIHDVKTDANRSTTTNTQGFYEFLAVKPSVYDLSVEIKGFEKAVKHQINVVVGLESHLDVALKPGSVTETVEVKTEVPLIEPEKTNVSYSIESQQIQNLPLQGRQFLDLALLTPGVTAQAPGTQAGGINVSGMRSQSNNFTLSGISINDPQVNGPLNLFHIADAVQEFNVNTSIAGTDLGRSSGAQVTIITKSGTNTYHGSAFYYGRNEALDANDWFLNLAGKPRNVLRRHQYGGTIGGFVFKDKTFWFLSFEGFKEKSPLPQLSTVPTAAARATVTDPVSQKLLQFIPSPNIANPTPLGNWAGTADQTTNNDTYLLRVDHALSANNHLMGQYLNVRGDSLSLQQNPFNGSITNLPGSQSAVIEETFSHVSWLNVARLGYTRNVTDFGPQDVKINPASIFTDSLGNPLPGFVDTTKPGGALNGGLPRITFLSTAAVPLANFGLGAGTNMPQGRTTNTYELIDNVTKTLGVHTLQFGGEIKHEQTFRFLNGNFRGAIQFASWANFALGIPRNGSLRTGGPDQTFRTWNRYVEYVYIQDSWKAKSNLTLNYGVRYELPGALAEGRDSGSNLVPGVGIMKLNSNLVVNVDPNLLGTAALSLTPVNGVTLPSTGQFHNATKNFAPFVGMAYSPKMLPSIFGDGKTVIRTGFRLSYDDVFANIPVNMGLNFPPVLSTTLPNGAYTWGTALNQNRRLFAADSTLTSGPTCGGATPCRGIVGFNAWDTTGRTAYGMNFALEIERQIGREYAINASYVGSLGRRLGVFIDANEPFVTANNPLTPGSALPNKRTFPFVQYQALPIGRFAASSNYNGAVLSVRKRPSHGISFQGSYTYAKSLDYNSSFFGSDGEFGSFADVRNPQADYGPSAFDIRQQLVFSYLYELPFGKGRRFMPNANTVVDQFLGGWDFGGITSWRTGFPFTIFANTGQDFSGFNQFADRPNAGNTPLTFNYDDPNHAFPTTQCPASPCYFSLPGAGSVGNMGRNAFYGPHYTDFDLSLHKNFTVSEGKKFQLRADVFNVFNHPNFNLPVSNLGSGSAGKITRMYGNSRLMQLGLRFDF
jgi:Carboxypeptidase regulatory-like domain/TonB-dependent Receptor Plug Domain